MWDFMKRMFGVTSSEFKVTDPDDLAFLRIAEGSTIGNTILPSGTITPTPPEGKAYRVRNGKLVLENR